MGVIQRQGIKQTLITFFGIAIGAVNVLFIYPRFLLAEQWGFIQIILSASKIFLPFIMMGSMYMIVRFFPEFKDEKNGHHGYLPFVLSWIFVGFSIFLGLFIFFQEEIFSLSSKEADKQMVAQYGFYLLPILLFLAIGTTLTKYISNFQRIVVPAIFNDIFVKVGLPALCILLGFDIINFENLLQGIGWIYLIIVVALLIYTKNLGQLYLKPDFSKLTKEKLKPIFIYSGYGLLGGLGTTIIPFIDTIMVGALIDFESSAIYTIPNFISNAIDAPRKALSSIAAPLIAESWKKNDLPHIKMLYQKTSLNQLIVGVLLFLLAWSCIDDIYNLIPAGPKKETYEAGKYVVLILGLSKVLDMATGVNSEIIGYSRYFRFNFYAILILTVFAIISNWLLIPIYGIEGAAMATFLSFGIFNLSKFLFLWFKLNLQPFSIKTIHVLLFGGLAYLAASQIPDSGWIIPNIILKCLVIGIIFGGSMLYFRVSEDISAMVEKFWKEKIS